MRERAAVRALAVAIAAAVTAGLATGGCGGGEGDDVVADPPANPDAGVGPGPAPDGAPPTTGPRACPDLYAEEILPTFEIEIAPEEWEALEVEYATWRQREAAGLPRKPYHPLIAFRYGAELVTDAQIRLKGNRSWDGTKMQFQISFNETNRNARFHGLRKFVLDAPYYDRSFLYDRLALSVLRDLGLPAPCANHARLVVNGTYYGLYTNLEKVDREFLERVFGKAAADGNLYKYGVVLETNEETGDTSRLSAFRDAAREGDLATIEAMADLEQAVRAWAGEAVLPQPDGYWAGRGNYYLYDRPARGFVWISWDLDAAFDGGPVNADPVTWHASNREKAPHYQVVLADEGWSTRYHAALVAARAAYDPEVLTARIDAWAAQIAQAAAEDAAKPFSTAQHVDAVARLRAFVAARVGFLDEWLVRPPSAR